MTHALQNAPQCAECGGFIAMRDPDDTALALYRQNRGGELEAQFCSPSHARAYRAALAYQRRRQ